MEELEQFYKNPGILVATVTNLFRLDGYNEEVEILSDANYKIEQTDYDNWNGGTYLFSLYLQISMQLFSKYNKKIEKFETSILGKIDQLLRPNKQNFMQKVYITTKLSNDDNWRAISVSKSMVDSLIKELDLQRNLMISVATGGPKINTKNQEYKKRQALLESLLTDVKIDNANPYNDLWEWYGKWSSGELSTYQSRRQFITNLFDPMIERVKKLNSKNDIEMFDEPTGWIRVDRSMDEIKKRLGEARNEEQFQAIGLLCRETIISLAQVVYIPSIHKTIDGIEPSQTDAKRMLEAYVQHELSGGTNEIARKYAKASLDLANDLTHRRTANFRLAALCAEATSSVVSIVSIISGQRDPIGG